MPNVFSDKLSDLECSKIGNSTIPRCSLCDRCRSWRYWKGYIIVPSQNVEEHICLRPNYKKFKSIIKVMGFYCTKSVIQIYYYYYANASLEVIYVSVYIVEFFRERSLDNKIEMLRDFL